MKFKDKILTIYHNSNDLSKSLYRVEGKESVTILDSDYIYIGYKKPLRQLYFELDTANTNTSIFTIEKYNGSSWEEVDGWDETSGLSESGFMFLDEYSSEAVTTIESIEQYWIRLSLDVSSSAMELRFLNLIFSNEDDLLNDEPDIKKYYPADLDSHVFSMVASREYILRKINNSGKFKYKESTEEISQINQFDIFDINELREASNYYTLYKIFSNLNDSNDDNYKGKAEGYFEKFKASYKVFQGSMLSLDTDDSGTESDAEKTVSIRTTKLRR